MEFLAIALTLTTSIGISAIGARAALQAAFFLMTQSAVRPAVSLTARLEEPAFAARATAI